MNNFSMLSEEEYKKICSVIPHKLIVGYFQKNPKEFSKLQRGFRPTAVQHKDAIKLLVTYRERGFISSFVEKTVNRWLKEINDVVQEYQNNGESEITSYIYALYQSFFADNVSAYFILIGKDYSDDQLNMITGIVSMLKKIEEKQHELDLYNGQLKEQLNNSEKNVEKCEKLVEKSKKKIVELTDKLSELELLQKKHQELLNEYEQSKKEKDSSILKVDRLMKQITELECLLKAAQKEKEELESLIRAKIEEEKEAEFLNIVESFPFEPVDMEEFKEYLSYNFKSIASSKSDLPVDKLFTTYVSDIIFQGKPIVCSKNSALAFAKCISNTLVGSVSIDLIEFSPDLDEKKICFAINNSGRIVVLDNFLGNYNETVLLSILERFKSKIVILSVTYEKTLFYLPSDFFIYSNYINLSHISGFSRESEPDEDPSVIEEKETKNVRRCANNRHRKVISSIALELGFSSLLSEKTTEFICDDVSASAALVFNVIPYVNDVLGKNAFNLSESLQRYVGRCPYKNVIEEWFMA